MISQSPNAIDSNSGNQGPSDGTGRVFCRGWLQPAISAARRYGLALVSVSVAFVLAQTFLYYGLPQPFTAFALSAIAGTFWYGGTKPGILAALISWLVRDYFFEPEVSIETRILYGLVFLVFALVMILVMRGRNELEARVAERTAELKRANEDLTLEIARRKGTEDELRATMDTAPVFLWSDLPDGYCDFLNQRWLTYFNLSLQEAQGAGWTTLLHPDDAAHHLESWQKSVATGIPFETEARFRRPDGEYRWFLNRAVPLRDKMGRIVKWYGTNIDIENLKQTERKLRQSESNLAEAQRLSQMGSWALTPATSKILYWSEECYRLWGFDPEQGLPYRASVLQRIHPDDRDRVYDEAQEALRQKRDYTIEFRIVLPDGKVKYLEAINHHVFSAPGELVQVIGTNVDVTERKVAEKALLEREAKIRRLVDANIIGIFMWDLDGQIFEANDAFLRMVGYNHADLVSGRMRWTELTPPEWRDPDLRRWVPELKMTGSLQPFEKEYFRKDGSRVPVLIGVAAFEEDGDQGVAFVLDLTERKRAEQALRESEYKLRQIIDTVPGFLWSADPAGDPTHVNQHMLDYSGMRLEDFKHGGWETFVHPDDFPETARALHHAIQTGTSYQAVNRLRRADGEFRWHHTRGEPLRDQHGRIIQWYGLNIDIDEAKKAEDRLRRSEAHLAEAQRLSHTGSAVYNETEILYWSVEASRIWGFDPLQGIPSREAVWQRILPDDLDRVNENIEHGVLEKRSFTNEFRIILPDGTVKHIEATNYPVFSASGELLEILATGMDVTERKQAEQALRESEAKFRDYAETASDWFWEIGPDYKFTLLTENAFGSDAADRIGTACWEHALDLETEPEKWRLVRATLDSRQPFREFVYCSAGRNGSPMYVKASGKPVFDANGEFRGYRGTGSDVTAIVHAQEEHERLRQLESDLAHMNRLSVMGELTASLAHEIAQPIATARNNARAAMGFLDRSPPDISEVREALECLVADADRAGDIIDRIRDQIKKAPPRKGRFVLSKAINEVIVLARNAITRNGISVQTRLAEELAPVQGDRVQLQQVVLNLILNAVEAMSSVEPGARELLISTEQNQTGDVVVAVRDSGPGIDPEHVQRVFEAFYTTKSGGTGMGLSICRSIIDAHGGRLWAEANEPRGTAFQFTWPSAEKGLMNSLRPAHQTGEPHEDTASDASHQLAYEGNKRLHRSGRAPDQRHSGRQ
jgi:PAS domain S-box-containing protein